MCEPREVENKIGPRERLMAAAQRLTYSQGATVGVDAILKEANVARRSLYEHFGGKDGLVAEVLRRSAVEDEAAYRATLDGAGDDPRTRLLAVFDDLDRVVAAAGFRGCRYLAADLALAAADHPAHAVTREYRARIHELLAAEVRRTGHAAPELAADQLQLLIDGVLAVGATRPEVNPAAAARALAAAVLDGQA